MVPGGRDLLKVREGSCPRVAKLSAEMRGNGRFAAIGLLVIAACSGGGGGSAAPTTTSSHASTTTTTQATTTTTTVEDAVKTAYLAYWRMADRLLAAPDPNDPELTELAAEPLLSSLKDQLATSAATGHHTSVPPGRVATHRVDSVSVTQNSASLTECFVDGRVEFGPNGEVIDDALVTKTGDATMTLVLDAWKVTDIRFVSRSPGVSGCAAS
jgi:hypothetical protein